MAHDTAPDAVGALKPKRSPSEYPDDGYREFEQLVTNTVATMRGPLFATDADPEMLWDAYINGIQAVNAGHRQHYNCTGCRRFIQKYGGLVTINTRGELEPALWAFGPMIEVPPFFGYAVATMRRIARKAKVTSLFICGEDEKVWGTPTTAEWSHLSGLYTSCAPPGTCYRWQKSNYGVEDFGMLSRALADFSLPTIQEAYRLLKAVGVLSSPEKTIGVADWFCRLAAIVVDGDRRMRDNLIWLHVAGAPEGFCHLRSGMLGTLLESIVAKDPLPVLQRKWNEKVAPEIYQRPQSPPKEGNIDQAEKLVAKLGIGPSLRRRFARLEDITCFIWEPKPETPAQPVGGTFNHLRAAVASPNKIELPPTKMTWEKFRRTVLAEALSIEMQVPYGNANFGALVTAADPAAPPILQWDGLEGLPRNPVSAYVYVGGSQAAYWGLTQGTRVAVTAICPKPSHWQVPDKFTHQGEGAFICLAGCRDRRQSGVALFPANLKSELHEIRSVIEAFSNKGTLEGREEATASGYLIGPGQGTPITLRVKAPGGYASYIIDRWD